MSGQPHEQLTIDELVAGHAERSAAQPQPAPRPHRPAPPPAPPRIPVEEQRLVRVLVLLAAVALIGLAAGLLTVDPQRDRLAGLVVALLLGATVACALAPLLLVESYRRQPGMRRVRRRRALRRGGIVGLLVGGYAALRIAGIGGPTGLAVATLLALVVEVALTRADVDAA